jgi:alpha-N-acetylglucosaminidase
MASSDLPGSAQRGAQLAAADGVALRVLGGLADAVRFHGMDAKSRSFVYRAKAGRLDISATDGVSACVGLHSYLREVCAAAVSWDTILPLALPALPDSEPVRKTARVHEGYYYNFCTFSYTTAYWDWPAWEREIDWMALHGITMPLSAVGFEAAVIHAYKRLGLPEDEIRAFLGGPGYLPFQYMGCVDSFAGPLPASWVRSHADLGRRILGRQRDLGMTPVVPAFAGNVPKMLAPGRATSRQWCGIESFFLDPADPLYRRAGAEIVRAHQELFGPVHHYAADPFIEMLPVSSDESYPELVARATVEGLRAADPGAIWVTQAWPFAFHSEYWTPRQVRRLLHAVPDGALLVLDLWGETDPQWSRLDGFCGRPWIWCALLNFGGRNDLIGNPQASVSRANEAVGSASPPIGIGLSMEGSHHNAAYFELVLDQIWNATEDLTEWVDDFAVQRYGRATERELTGAWRALAQTVYDPGKQVTGIRQWRSVMIGRPSLLEATDPGEVRRQVGESLWYDPAVLARAWQRMLETAEHEPALAAGPLGHDLVEVAASVMGRVADRHYLDAVEQAHRGDDVREAVDRFLGIFTDLDRLLATRTEFTLRSWEDQAAAWAANACERTLLLDNARRILTVWDHPASRQLDDYAARFWAGLVGGYYRDRWRLWSEGLAAAVAGDADRAERNLDEQLQATGQRFLDSGAEIVHAGLGDVIAESRRLFDRYGAYLATRLR